MYLVTTFNHYVKEEKVIIELQRQWVGGEPAYIPHDGGDTRCAVCCVPFEEPSVVAWAWTDARDEMGLACPACVEYLGRRNPDRFPAIGVYRELLAAYPEPMYPSGEALEAAAEAAGCEDPSELVEDASWVWRAPEEGDDVVPITPTIIHRAYPGPDVAHEFTHGGATVEVEGKGRALIVFRSQEEAERYRAATGKHPEEEGFRVASLDLEELGHVLEEHECTHVAMPEEWTEDRSGRVDFFRAPDFIGMLRPVLAEGRQDV